MSDLDISKDTPEFRAVVSTTQSVKQRLIKLVTQTCQTEVLNNIEQNKAYEFTVGKFLILSNALLSNPKAPPELNKERQPLSNQSLERENQSENKDK